MQTIMTNISSSLKKITPPSSVVLSNQIYQMRQEGKDVVSLALGEAYFDMPLKSFENLKFPESYHYSPARGVDRLRTKLADYFVKEYQTTFDPDSQIVITAGSKIAIYMIFLALLDQGDEVIIPEPYWVSYTEQAKLVGGKPVTIPYTEEVKNYEKYISEKTKCLVINNPNNPQGKIYSKEELEYLLELARKHDFYILSDEAYSDFVLEEGKFHCFGKLDPTYKNTIVVNSMSKNFGMSGWRIGYAITNENLSKELLMLNQHLITNAPTILQYYLAEYFEEIVENNRPQIIEVVKKRQRIAGFMDEIGLKYLPGEATFYFMVSIEESKFKSNDFGDKLLNDYLVSVVPGIGYGKSCDRLVRVGVGSESEERIKIALEAMKQLIDKTA